MKINENNAIITDDVPTRTKTNLKWIFSSSFAIVYYHMLFYYNIIIIDVTSELVILIFRLSEYYIKISLKFLHIDIIIFFTEIICHDLKCVLNIQCEPEISKEFSII